MRLATCALVASPPLLSWPRRRATSPAAPPAATAAAATTLPALARSSSVPAWVPVRCTSHAASLAAAEATAEAASCGLGGSQPGDSSASSSVPYVAMLSRI
eukprot:357713-Chlamydomonas_euryale.AAC.13